MRSSILRRNSRRSLSRRNSRSRSRGSLSRRNSRSRSRSRSRRSLSRRNSRRNRRRHRGGYLEWSAIPSNVTDTDPGTLSHNNLVDIMQGSRPGFTGSVLKEQATSGDLSANNAQKTMSALQDLRDVETPKDEVSLVRDFTSLGGELINNPSDNGIAQLGNLYTEIDQLNNPPSDWNNIKGMYNNVIPGWNRPITP